MEDVRILYAVELKRTDLILRLALYEMAGNEMRVIWPTDCHLGKRANYLLPFQVWSERKNLPAFHFLIQGYGFDKLIEIADGLSRKWDRPVRILKLNGGSPQVSESPERKEVA